MGKRVLLCDDEVHIVRAAEIKLARAGFDVETASDGEAGWEAILRQKPDVVVTDCQMPRLDGLGLIDRIRANPQTRDIALMMLTGKGYELSAEQLAAQYGVLALIAKPFSPRELVELVTGVLAETV